MKKIFFYILCSSMCLGMRTERRKSRPLPSEETDAEIQELLQADLAQRLKVLLGCANDWEEEDVPEYAQVIELVSNGYAIAPSTWCAHIAVDDEIVFLPGVAARRSCLSLFRALFEVFHRDYLFDPTQQGGDEQTLTDIAMERIREKRNNRTLEIYAILQSYSLAYQANRGNRQQSE